MDTKLTGNYSNRIIRRVEVFINQGGGSYEVGKRGIRKILDTSLEFENSLHNIYTCVDVDNKVLYRIENCNCVVSYKGE